MARSITSALKQGSPASAATACSAPEPLCVLKGNRHLATTGPYTALQPAAAVLKISGAHARLLDATSLRDTLASSIHVCTALIFHAPDINLIRYMIYAEGVYISDTWVQELYTMLTNRS